MKDNSGKIILALLAGASAGVIAGLLMAPDTGETTRGNLKKTASKLTKDLEKTFQDGLKKLESMDTGALTGGILGKKGNGNGSNATASTSNTSSGSNTGSVQGSTSSGGTTSGATGGASGSTPRM